MTEARYLRRLYWQSFAIRFGAGFLGWFVTFVLGLSVMEDANFYEETGASVAQDWLRGRSSVWLDEAIAEQRVGWLMVAAIAACYTAMGGIRFLPALIMVFCLATAWVPVLTYRIGRRLGQQPATARVGARLVAYSPAFAFWSGALYKEGLILLALNLLIYHALILQRHVRTRSILVVCACLVALLGLRFYIAIMAGVVIVGGSFMLGGTSARSAPCPTWRLVLRPAIILGLILLALVDFSLNDSILEQLPASTEAALGRIDNSRRDLASFSSRYLPEADVRTPDKALAFMPVGTLYFLFVPLPWQFGSLRQNVVIPETAFWIALYPLILLGMRRGLRRHFQGSILLIVLIVVVSLFYGIFLGNIGTAYRMRIQVWLLGALFVGWGWEQYKESRRKRTPRWKSV
jgi:hypothetical protein